jgi:hypothetical protein
LRAVERLRLPGWRLAGAVKTFQREWETSLDLRRQSRALTALAERFEAAGEGPERPVAARPVAELCSPSVLTVALPEPLEEGMEGAGGEASYRHFRGWLLLAVVEGVLWTGPWVGSVHRLAPGSGGLRGGVPLWTGGEALRLDRKARWALRDYLAATHRGDPDHALHHLLQGAVRDPEEGSWRALRDRLRQVVPPVEAAGSALASLFLSHAHLLAIHGLRPVPWLAEWYRSLAALDRWVTTDGEEDPLAEALEDVRMLGAAARAREVLAPSAFARSWSRQSNRWLDTLEGAGEGFSPHPPRPARRARIGGWIGFGALAVLLILTAFVAHRLGPSHPAIVPTLALLFGGLALFTLVFTFRA